MKPNPFIYQIYVDAFARGSSGRSQGRRRGGDLEGVIERLDHVASLGAEHDPLAGRDRAVTTQG